MEQVKSCLQTGDYSRALALLRGAAASSPSDPELSQLKKLAEEGARQKTEADRLITKSQALFAQQMPAEAIQSLRQAYALDTNNSLARTILANALVEHAQSLVETDWWEAGKLSKQALELNPAHPTAKTIRTQIRDRKEASTVDDWIAQVQHLQSAGDLASALSLLAEGLDVHSRDPKLLLLQDAIQRDYNALRRQARRGDLQDLRRMKNEIDRAADAAAKQALAERIQGLAAKYWTDGEVLALANGLLQRLRLGGTSSARPHSDGAPIIFHVPLPSAAKPSVPECSQMPAAKAAPVVPNVPAANQPAGCAVAPAPAVAVKPAPPPLPPANVPTGIPAQKSAPVLPHPLGERRQSPPDHSPQPEKPVAPPKTQPAPAPPAAVAVAEPPAIAEVVPRPTQPDAPAKSNTITIALVAAAAVILVAATFFVTRKHYTAVEKIPVATPAVPALIATAPPVSSPEGSTPGPRTPEPSPAVAKQFETDSEVGSQEDHAAAKVSRAPERESYPEQKTSARREEEARPVADLQPQPRPASLTLQGATPGALVLIDQAPAGTIQPDGTLALSTISPGDHSLELRKDRFKPRQLKEHFVAGGTVSLGASDIALESLPAELKITFTPTDANVAVAKGDFLKVVSSGVPLTLAPGTYTLTARTAERFTRSATLDIAAGESKTLDLSLAPSGMSKWEDASSWKQEKDYFIRKGGEFVLYGASPAAGTFSFSAMAPKGRQFQWVLNYTDAKNYLLFQMDDNYFYRAVIRNGEKTEEIRVPDKGDKKSFRALRIRVSPTEIVQQSKHGDSWTVLDRWTQPGTNLALGKFGFYLPGNDEVAVSGFTHYADLNIR